MIITLYKTSSDDLEVNKTLTKIGDYTCSLLDECSISEPMAILTLSADALDANYAYIADYNRYYWAKVTIINGHEIKVDMAVDRLMSFINPNKTNLVGYVERNENNFNANIVDDQAIFTNDRDIKTVAITMNGLTKPLENWKLIGVFNAGLCNTIEEVTP